MERLNNSAEKRRYPRFLSDLPLENRVMDIPYAHGGLIANACEMSLLIERSKDIPIGLKVNITVLFPRGYQLANFEVLAEVVWKDAHCKDNWRRYQYGLKFVSIKKHDHWKLRQLLYGRFNLDGISCNL